MKIRTLLAGLVLSGGVAAATPADYANQWTLSTGQEGAYAIALDEGIYRQVTRPDLSDLAAYNADGEELALGPLPPAYSAPERRWKDAVWFALPQVPDNTPGAGDLHLHVTRSADGSLSLDSTLTGAASATPSTATQDLLVDVRAKDELVEALAFDFVNDVPDFSANVDIESSDDLRVWRQLVADAPLASFRQHGQSLVRRTVEFGAQPATYLRVHASMPLRLIAVHQLEREPGSEPARATLDAAFVRRDGNAFVYALPARVAAERLSIGLADDNAVAHFAVFAREEGGADWNRIGDYTAFRLRGGGMTLDAEPMDIGTTRMREWRIEPDGNIAKTPVVRFDYRPEGWIVLAHGRAPYVLVAGSRRASRGEFPIDVLVGQLRARYGESWRPTLVGHGPMRVSAGAAAMNGWDAKQGRTWLLWGVLVLGAGVVAYMVIGLLRAPPR